MHQNEVDFTNEKTAKDNMILYGVMAAALGDKYKEAFIVQLHRQGIAFPVSQKT